MRGPDLDCPRQGSLLHARDLPTIPSPPTSRVQPGFSFVHHSALAVISGCGYLNPAWGFAHHSQARPARCRRIGFVILRTGRSPPLLPTLESLQRSPFGYRGMNFSRRRTFTALVTPLAGARVRRASAAFQSAPKVLVISRHHTSPNPRALRVLQGRHTQTSNLPIVVRQALAQALFGRFPDVIQAAGSDKTQFLIVKELRQLSNCGGTVGAQHLKSR